MYSYTMELIYEAKSFHWKVFYLLSLITFQQTFGETQTEGMNFFQSTLCDLNDRLTDGCSVRVPNTRSKIECLLICKGEISCIGSSLDENGNCFKHYECPSITSCKTEFQNHFYVSKQCDNDGVWTPSTGKCQCGHGESGTSCQIYPRSLSEMSSNGYNGDFKQFFINPENDVTKLIPISGSTSSTHNYIIVMSNWGLGGFNRSWADYRDGFQSDDGSYGVYWIGLKWLHAVTKAGYTILKMICAIKGVGQPHRFYEDFHVSDETNGFVYTFSKTRQSKATEYYIGDCFGPYQNTRFSTWDRDGDDDVDKNCASRAGSAWWYKDCNNPCHMLGWGTNLLDTKPSHELMSVLGNFDEKFFKDMKIKVILRRPT